jgi:hypothetical protein
MKTANLDNIKLTQNMTVPYMLTVINNRLVNEGVRELLDPEDYCSMSREEFQNEMKIAAEDNSVEQYTWEAQTTNRIITAAYFEMFPPVLPKIQSQEALLITVNKRVEDGWKDVVVGIIMCDVIEGGADTDVYLRMNHEKINQLLHLFDYIKMGETVLSFYGMSNGKETFTTVTDGRISDETFYAEKVVFI